MGQGGSNRCHESFNDDSFNDGGDSFFVNVIDSILDSRVMICLQQFYNIFTTNPKWQVVKFEPIITNHP